MKYKRNTISEPTVKTTRFSFLCVSLACFGGHDLN